MLDPALVEALQAVVAEEGQPPQVAQRLIAWLNQTSTSEPTRDENTHFLKNVHDALSVKVADAN
ncbi:MAG: hypothetical protein A2790_20105 [Phenylobacterium sp. RIFCSPHIGHO2_01_FULL_69_31]|uniref:CxC ATPase DNA modification system associated small protein n=1 Tax=Phenylobacterium sp. RIFCSPHIGHO2_01_FULL_69_31 TaxID=1801944 RepID=UPI0008C0F36E|nr:CxC ATPase DNA modification system associated small protein [Phenylobacterium sp. RIFCSPHIGHO2_01_FULL_69_31]OHB26272.1 MAG: hypothetical protein A2790_20105 [Phenylobacterium sp. RIFCSPHIGHO2_01_FULL_69_31]